MQPDGVILRKEGFPDIEVTPDELVMPNTAFGGSSEEELTISNNGDELLIVSDIYSTEPEFTVDPSSLYVAPGESEIVTVTFSPPEPGIYSANIIIESDDPDEPVVQVPVTGEGVLPIPAIEVIPAEIVWDSLEVGTYDNEMLVVKNVGYGTLTVSDIISTNDPPFTASPTNFTLEPGESDEVIVTFAPLEEMMYEGEIQVLSNDPDNEQTDVMVLGYGLSTVGFSGANQLNDIRIYPNPFHNSVVIELAIELNKEFTIEIWDINGRQVFMATLNSLQNGSQIRWDGKDTNGQAVSPGIYPGRIRIGDFWEDFELIKH